MSKVSFTASSCQISSIYYNRSNPRCVSLLFSASFSETDEQFHTHSMFSHSGWKVQQVMFFFFLFFRFYFIVLIASAELVSVIKTSQKADNALIHGAQTLTLCGWLIERTGHGRSLVFPRSTNFITGVRYKTRAVLREDFHLITPNEGETEISWFGETPSEKQLEKLWTAKQNIDLSFDERARTPIPQNAQVRGFSILGSLCLFSGGEENARW